MRVDTDIFMHLSPFLLRWHFSLMYTELFYGKGSSLEKREKRSLPNHIAEQNKCPNDYKTCTKSEKYDHIPLAENVQCTRHDQWVLSHDCGELFPREFCQLLLPLYIGNKM